MKKITIIALLVFSAIQSSFAQDEKPKKFGIRAGYQSSFIHIDGSKLATTEALNSFYIGVFKEKKIVPMLHFGSGLEYFQTGFESNLVDLQRKLHYLSVPLYLKVKLGPVYATGGTALNFKVAENNDFLDTSTDPLTEKSNWFDMPLQAGLGVQVFMISVELRYNWGMINLNDFGAKNQYLQLGLGMSF